MNEKKTPDWILEYFIFHFSAYSGLLMMGGSWNLKFITIAAQPKYESKIPANVQ